MPRSSTLSGKFKCLRNCLMCFRRCKEAEQQQHSNPSPASPPSEIFLTPYAPSTSHVRPQPSPSPPTTAWSSCSNFSPCQTMPDPNVHDVVESPAPSSIATTSCPQVLETPAPLLLASSPVPAVVNILPSWMDEHTVTYSVPPQFTARDNKESDILLGHFVISPHSSGSPSSPLPSSFFLPVSGATEVRQSHHLDSHTRDGRTRDTALPLENVSGPISVPVPGPVLTTWPEIHMSSTTVYDISPFRFVPAHPCEAGPQHTPINRFEQFDNLPKWGDPQPEEKTPPPTAHPLS